jgi:AraC family transcriptional regulator, transcriptional activator of the genes for pyochelin and ferripyochelin receptors
MKVITESNLCQQTQESLLQRELIYNSNGSDRIEICQNNFNKINYQTVKLRSSLNLDVCKELFDESLNIKSQYKETCTLISNFYILRNRKAISSSIQGVAKISQQPIGDNYLFYLPGTQQIKQSLVEQECYFLGVHLDIYFVKSFLTSSKQTLPEQLQLFINNGSSQIFQRQNGEITPAMRTVLNQIINAPYEGTMQLMYLESKTLELLTLQLAQWVEAEKGKQNTVRLKADVINKIYQAKEILLSNQAKPPTINDLAAQVEITPTKLKENFKQIFGTTMFGYLRNYRMEMARNLLLEKDMNVTEVASSVGYSNSSQFAAAFKHKFGITPKECRQEKKVAEIRNLSSRGENLS